MKYEISAGYFETAIANQPKIHTFEPKFNFKKAVRPITTSHKVRHIIKYLFEQGWISNTDGGFLKDLQTLNCRNEFLTLYTYDFRSIMHLALNIQMRMFTM